MNRCTIRRELADVDRRVALPPRNGVSLLEVIVAITLAMVMLGAVWSLASLLTKRYEAQLRLAEQNQITRSIQQRLLQDLNSIVYSNQEPNWSTETSSKDVNNFFALPNLFWPERLLESDFSKPSVVPALTGDATELTFSVHTDSWEIAWSEYQQQARMLAGDSSARSPMPTPSMVRRVRYALVRAEPLARSPTARLGADDPNEEEVDPPLIGLTREEWEETPHAATQNRESAGNADRVLEKTRDQFADDEENRQMDRPATHRLERIEEIENLRFHYFDGERWHRSWDSLQEGRLPCAILFQFSFAPKKSKSSEQTPDAQLESVTYPSELEPEPEIEEPEFAELIADERFEFNFLLRLQTPARVLQENKSPLEQSSDVRPQGPREAPR